MSFEVNQGQANRQFDFISRGTDFRLYVNSSGALLAVQHEADNASMLRMTFAKANRSPAGVALEELPGKANYFIGHDPAQWRVGVPTYSKVKYTNIYPGVDVVYYGNKQLLEYDFVVAPGADPHRIQLVFQGQQGLRVDAEGNLLLKVGSGEIVQRKPFVYQEIERARREIPGRYVIDHRQQVSFAVGNYDHTKPLVIDPVLI
ncbi:MAG TPA: hypothetical protein VFH31_12260, partial [Pyrinomonadaceae bacterium]|nr:hypothetical protein [Pyrinomonadaceae bacterium]